MRRTGSCTGRKSSGEIGWRESSAAGRRSRALGQAAGMGRAPLLFGSLGDARGQTSPAVAPAEAAPAKGANAFRPPRLSPFLFPRAAQYSPVSWLPESGGLLPLHSVQASGTHL